MIDIVQDPEFAEKMVRIGLVTTGRPGAEVARLAKTQREALRPIVEKSGFRVTQ